MLIVLALILIPSAVVFFVALLGNFISFGNRYANAAVSAVLSMIIVGLACWFWGIKAVLVFTLATGAVVFIADIVSNLITFTNRFGNALAKTMLFAVPFGVFVYSMSPMLAE
jgi:hypothetical protein